MKTEKLVEALVADRAPRGRPLRWALAAGARARRRRCRSCSSSSTLGVRADIEPALATWRFDLKVGLVLLALGLAFGLCLECRAAVTRPAIPARRLLPLAALAVAGGRDRAVVVPSGVLGERGWSAATRWSACRRSRLLSIAPLAAVLAILRRGAPASPALAGAAAGLLAAAAGAALYAFHCFDDSPLFVVTWYSLAAIPIVLIGRLRRPPAVALVRRGLEEIAPRRIPAGITMQ